MREDQQVERMRKKKLPILISNAQWTMTVLSGKTMFMMTHATFYLKGTRGKNEAEQTGKADITETETLAGCRAQSYNLIYPRLN